MVCFVHFELVLCATTACNFSSLIWPAGSAPAALASLLFDPPEPQIIGKNTVFRDFPTFSRICIFFLLTLSLLLFSLPLPYSVCFSSVHIVGSLTSKLPSNMRTNGMVLSFQLRFQPWIYFTAHHVLHLQSISFDLTSLIDLCTFFASSLCQGTVKKLHRAISNTWRPKVWRRLECESVGHQDWCSIKVQTIPQPQESLANKTFVQRQWLDLRWTGNNLPLQKNCGFCGESWTPLPPWSFQPRQLQQQRSQLTHHERLTSPDLRIGSEHGADFGGSHLPRQVWTLLWHSLLRAMNVQIVAATLASGMLSHVQVESVEWIKSARMVHPSGVQTMSQ